MAYYNRELKMLELPMDELEFLSEGGTSNVFRYNDIIYKEYFDSTPISCTLKTEVYEVLNSIDSKNMMKIYDIYSDENIFRLYVNRFFHKSFQVKAYIARYYEEDSIGILSKSIDYFLDNCRELDKLARTLSEHSVVMYDVKRWNSILTTDNIVIIDPDYFSLTNGSKEITHINNKEAILNLLHDIFARSISELFQQTEISYSFDKHLIINELFKEFFQIELTAETDIAYELSKKIKHVKKPVDYFAGKL